MSRLLVLLVALVAVPAWAQPSADALLRTWTENWDDAARGLASVSFEEALVRAIEGPRGTLDIETRGTIQLFLDQRPRRSVTDAWVNDDRIDLEKRSEMERRLRHALGRASSDLTRPAPLPIHLLDSSEPMGAVRDVRLGSDRAWQVSLLRPSRRGPAERLTAWFTPSRSAPRLLRIERDRRLRHNDTLTRATTYTRIDGLDLPVSHTVDAQIEQRRRLRTYSLVIHSEVTYSAPELEWE
ncbi:MAG: hypothetical protein Rubg2KO_10390 [Rubricoccaceae bacterium]